MTQRGMLPATDPLPSRVSEVVELRLLLAADQAAALEAAARRLEQTVGALLRRVVDDFLQSHASVGFVGEVPGRPTTPSQQEDR